MYGHESTSVIFKSSAPVCFLNCHEMNALACRSLEPGVELQISLAREASCIPRQKVNAWAGLCNFGVTLRSGLSHFTAQL